MGHTLFYNYESERYCEKKETVKSVRLAAEDASPFIIILYTIYLSQAQFEH